MSITTYNINAETLIDGNLNITGKIKTTESIEIGSTGTITGDLIIRGNTDIDGTITVTGAADLNSSLDVAGTAQLNALNVTGNVGIGIANAQRKLHIKGGDSGRNFSTLYSDVSSIIEDDTDTILLLTGGNSNNSEIWFGDSDNTSDASGRVRYDHNNDRMEFWTNSSEKMRVTYDGKVGIGTMTPSQLLDVSGTAQLNALNVTGSVDIDGVINVQGGATLQANLYVAGATDLDSTLDVAGTAQLNAVNVSGNIGIGISNPISNLHIENNNCQTIKHVTLNLGGSIPTTYYPISTISTTNGGTHIYGLLGGHEETQGRSFFDLAFWARNTFDASGKINGDQSPNSIVVYNNNGIYTLYLKVNPWCQLNMTIESTNLNYSWNGSGSSTTPSGTLVFDSQNGIGIKNIMIHNLDGRLGLAVNSPLGKLHIKQLDDDNGGNLDTYNSASIVMERSANGNKWAIGNNLYNDLVFWYNTLDRGYLAFGSNVGQIDFTGQHRSQMDTQEKNISVIRNIEQYIGLIVSSNGKYVNDNVEINEALPKVILSNINNDKKVYGVISEAEDLEKENREYRQGTFVSVIEKQEGDDRIIINSVGEGGIWVSNVNGNFENGDYITTTELLEGYGTKQILNKDFLMNYTVAKITQDEDFTDMTNGRVINGIKCKFVGCTYHCG